MPTLNFAMLYQILGFLAPIMAILALVQMLPVDLGVRIPWDTSTLFLGAIACKLLAKE